MIAAAQLSSEPILPPVVKALGLVRLATGLILIRAMSMPSLSATTWRTLVLMPWPISMPPCETETLPSLAKMDTRQLNLTPQPLIKWPYLI